jgi:hypothetical protein
MPSNGRLTTAERRQKKFSRVNLDQCKTSTDTFLRNAAFRAIYNIVCESYTAMQNSVLLEKSVTIGWQQSISAFTYFPLML